MANFQELKIEMLSMAVKNLIKVKNQAMNPIVRFSIGKISTSDELIDFLTSKIGFKEPQLSIKLIIKHQN